MANLLTKSTTVMFRPQVIKPLLLIVEMNMAIFAIRVSGTLGVVLLESHLRGKVFAMRRTDPMSIGVFLVLRQGSIFCEISVAALAV